MNNGPATRPVATPPLNTAGAAFLCARAVRKTYRTGERPVEALRGASLEIREPGFYGIMGSSGSGKSTLLYLLAGLDRPDSGEIEVAGARNVVCLMLCFQVLLCDI